MTLLPAGGFFRLSFRIATGTINHPGKRENSKHENDKSTHEKFNQPLPFTNDLSLSRHAEGQSLLAAASGDRRRVTNHLLLFTYHSSPARGFAGAESFRG